LLRVPRPLLSRGSRVGGLEPPDEQPARERAGPRRFLAADLVLRGVCRRYGAGSLLHHGAVRAHARGLLPLLHAAPERRGARRRIEVSAGYFRFFSAFWPLAA